MATSTTATASALLRPEQVEALLVLPALSASVAATVSNVVRTGSTEHRLPVITEDPSAKWTVEGAEIAPSDLVVDEVVVTPRKLAALSIISRELADDSSPAAATAVGLGMARDIARQIDAAYFGDLAAPAPKGLGALVGFSAIDAGASFADLDSFHAGISAAEQVGAAITSWACSPATALVLAQLKTGAGSNASLMQPDPTAPGRRVVAGIGLQVSPAIADGLIWGIPADRSVMVVRQAARIDVDSSAYFSSDRVGIRGTMRVSFGYPHPAALVKITVTP